MFSKKGNIFYELTSAGTDAGENNKFTIHLF